MWNRITHYKIYSCTSELELYIRGERHVVDHKLEECRLVLKEFGVECWHSTEVNKARHADKVFFQVGDLDDEMVRKIFSGEISSCRT